jgi:hypothetical protein
MSIFTTRPTARWLVPVAVAAVALGGGALVNTLSAVAAPSLPPRTAAQLLVDLQTARLDGLSGTVVQRADLGLPALPAIAGQGSSDLTSLVSGSHTLRVWYSGSDSGADSARIALLGTLGESDIIKVGREVWTWNSRDKTATHRVLPAGDAAERKAAGAAPHGLDASQLPKTPQEAADLALKAVDPTTKVSTGRSGRVAGRTAYELILQPRDTGSLVGQVRLAIDSREHVPLRVQVYPTNSDSAAIEVAFTQVSFARPDPAQFKFAPPPGTKVTEEPASGTPEAKGPDATGKAPDPSAPKQPQTAVIGKGWTSVLVARMNDASLPGAGAAPDAAKGDNARGPANLLDALPRVNGGRLLSGRLFSVLLTDDGRVLVGAVRPDVLERAAADPAAALKAGR